MVKLARSTVENFINNKELELKRSDEKFLKEKRGVFVTLYEYPSKNLRGCIGYPLDILPLEEALQKAAISAAFDDPRFSSVREEELKRIIFEISVLTRPERIKVKDQKEYPKKIEIGRDGLIIRNGPFNGLLLPQVAVEYNWSEEQFLDNLAFKAGLTPDYIHHKDTEIFKFSAQIFAEKEPKGRIVEIKLKP